MSIPPQPPSIAGITTKASAYSFDETLMRVVETIQAKL